MIKICGNASVLWSHWYLVEFTYTTDSFIDWHCILTNYNRGAGISFPFGVRYHISSLVFYRLLAAIFVLHFICFVASRTVACTFHAPYANAVLLFNTDNRIAVFQIFLWPSVLRAIVVGRLNKNGKSIKWIFEFDERSSTPRTKRRCGWTCLKRFLGHGCTKSVTVVRYLFRVSFSV